MTARIPFFLAEPLRSLLALGLLSSSALTACDSPTEYEAPEEAGRIANGAPSAIEPQGWLQFDVMSDGAEIKLDPFGHFYISRNACWVEGSGALPLERWNPIAETLNRAAQIFAEEVRARPSPAPSGTPETEARRPEVCVAIGETPRALAGSATLRLESGVRVDWIRLSYDAVCLDARLFDDREQAIAFTRALDRWLLQAFTEDCTIAP